MEAAEPQANLNSDLTNKIKQEFLEKLKIVSELQGKYASRLSKYENLKQDSLKRKERLKNIDSEIKNWIDLKNSSEQKFKELNARLKGSEEVLTEEEIKLTFGL